ncbi:SMC-Scp complex subunit ScpB [Candidatus Nanosalina sp. VS9-1]|uniref:SMC-Scp complex subunit ScpB n=1 Tax=Candidatus Nanosalina sp. VS9-1 TaxID=3388566 RepID=UPI0039E05FAC
MDEKKSRMEAAFFLAEEPLEKDEISDVLNLGSMGFVEELIEDYQEDLEESHRGLELIRTENGYELKVKKDHLEHVSHLAPHQDLNEGQLRTLSLIAYNAPLEQADLVEIRGNRAYQHVKELVNRGFVDKEKDGRTAVLDVTDFFLEYFDIDSVDEFKRMADSDDEEASEEDEESHPRELL